MEERDRRQRASLQAWPTHESLALLERWLPCALIDPSSLEQLKRFSQRLSGPFSSYYLECRLAEGEARVDLLASLTAECVQDECESTPAMACAGENSSAWTSVERFLRAWTKPATRLHAEVPCVWLEFDNVNEAVGHTPEPSFHVCLDRDYLSRGGGLLGVKENEGRQRELLASTFEVLLGHPLPLGLSQGLHACFEAVGSTGRIIHASAMLARTPVTIKLYGCIPARDFPGYLQKLGWPGSLGGLSRLMAEFCSPSTIDELIYFDLALEERLTAYVGIVFSQPQLSAATNNDPRRQMLLKCLVGAGLCAPPKRDALLQWPGSARVQYPGSSGVARMHRWLDIKISHHPNRPIEAKAYLGFRPAFSLF